MISKILKVFQNIIKVFFPLGMIFYGTYLAYPPAAYIVIGSIIWIEIHIKDKEP